MSDITLDIDHPNKRRAEYFLNSTHQQLEEISFEWRNWKQADKIIGGYKFSGQDGVVFITLLFLDSYQDANDVAKANSLPIQPTAKWSVNGDLLYLVESNDEDLVASILSIFAGKE